MRIHYIHARPAALQPQPAAIERSSALGAADMDNAESRGRPKTPAGGSPRPASATGSSPDNRPGLSRSPPRPLPKRPAAPIRAHSSAGAGRAPTGRACSATARTRSRRRAGRLGRERRGLLPLVRGGRRLHSLGPPRRRHLPAQVRRPGPRPRAGALGRHLRPGGGRQTRGAAPGRPRSRRRRRRRRGCVPFRAHLRAVLVRGRGRPAGGKGRLNGMATTCGRRCCCARNGSDAERNWRGAPFPPQLTA